MKQLVLSLLIAATANLSVADVMIFANADKETRPLDEDLRDFISATLHTGKPASYLECDVKVREIREERRFSDGVRRVEMLEIIFFSRMQGVTEQKAYFPLKSKITKSTTNSRFSGTVEEIQMEAEDIVNSRFIFQHNGRGEIVWMSYEDDLRTTPCRLKR